MDLVFDNLIFFLQRSGGGSVYWSEVIRDSVRDKFCTFVEPNLAVKNIFRAELAIENTYVDRRPLLLQRLLAVRYAKRARHIFHSAYYRFSANKKATNVVTAYDFTHEYFYKGWQRLYHYLMKRRAIKKADGIICISESTKRDLLKFHPWAARKVIRVIHCGVSETFHVVKPIFDSTTSVYRSVLSEKYILFVGHRSTYKNFDKAVEVAVHLPSPFRLVVVGQPFTESENSMLEEKLSGRYMLLDGINSTDLNIIYNFAFCLLYPSSYEGFGIPILEAMRTGCPVVTTAASSIPEVAGVAGLMAEDERVETFLRLVLSLEVGSFREKVIEAGFRQCKSFSWEKCRKETFSFYRELEEMQEDLHR